MNQFLIIITFLISFSNIFSAFQQNTIDSLIFKLKDVNGEEKVDVFIKLADDFQYISTKKGVEYADSAINLAKKIDYKKGLASAYGSKGFCLISKDVVAAKDFTNKALSIRREINDQIGVSKSLNVLGVIDYYAGEYLSSIENHINSIKIKETLGDEVILATSYNNIALVYYAVEDFEKSLEYLYKALEIREATNNFRGVGIIKTNIGDIYLKQGDYKRARKYLEESLELNIEIGSIKAEANTYNSLGKLFLINEEHQKALENFNASLELYYNLGIKFGVANVENGLAELYMKLNNCKPAISHAKEALSNAKEVNSLENVYKAANTLAECYEKMQDFDNAFKYLKISKNSHDILWNESKLKKMNKIELDHKIEKMKYKQEEELGKQKLFNLYLVVSLILIGVILTLIIFNGRNKKITNQKLNRINNKLNETNIAKDRFLSIIAHDLRGPYQSNLGTTDFLVKEFDSLNKTELKSSIINLDLSLNKQYELLNQLLKWANLQSGNFDLSKEELSLFTSVNDVFGLMKLSADKKNIHLVNSVDNKIIVNADKNMLYLLLRNLISNSIKFSNSNNKVEVVTEVKDDKTLIAVVDEGVGIPKNDFENLFKIDVHYSVKGTNNEEGTGLGLILCKEIILKHGGNIWVESEVNKGSKISFTLS